jgi:hypothetical protein
MNEIMTLQEAQDIFAASRGHNTFAPEFLDVERNRLALFTLVGNAIADWPADQRDMVGILLTVVMYEENRREAAQARLAQVRRKIGL